MSGVKRYDAVHLRYEDNNIRYGEGCEVEVVTAADHDREIKYCLDAGIRAQLERDTLRTANQRLQADLDGERESARDANADYLELQAAKQRLEGEVKRLNSVLWAVSVQVDGNIRPTVRDLVNRLAGVNNGADPNDIYQYCDAIDAALRDTGEQP
jgi:hypothetical protein